MLRTDVSMVPVGIDQHFRAAASRADVDALPRQRMDRGPRRRSSHAFLAVAQACWRLSGTACHLDAISPRTDGNTEISSAKSLVGSAFKRLIPRASPRPETHEFIERQKAQLL